MGLLSLPVLWLESAVSIRAAILYGGLMAPSSKRTYANMLCFPGLLLPLSLTLWQAAIDPHLCQRLPNTHRQVWFSLLWDQCSFLLGPGAHNVLFVPSKSLLTQSCGSSVIKSHWPSKVYSLGVLSPSARSPGWEISCGPRTFTVRKNCC